MLKQERKIAADTAQYASFFFLKNMLCVMGGRALLRV